MIVRAKLLGKKNERRVVGWDGNVCRRVREGDEFEIPDDEIEVDEVVNGQKTGNKIKKKKFFSERWMEVVEDQQLKEVPVAIQKNARAQKPKPSGDADLI